MDDTVGSLTQFQKSIIIGSLLGDGYLRIISGRKDAFLEINHSFKQKDYVDWKYKMLKNIAGGRPRIRKNKGSRVAYRFYTKQLPELTDLLRMFYRNGKKFVPDLELDPIMLAVWFMDDGSKCRKSDVYLNTQQFDSKDHERIISSLYNLGLEARINKDKNYSRMRFLKSSLPRLQELISDYIVPSMKYKIEL
ncbi:MAG: LAGLIDADG endonuclease [Patescibacteria group bacterium]